MGMPMYGQSFTLDNPRNHGLNAPANQKGFAGPFTRVGGFLAFYEICEMVKTEQDSSVSSLHLPVSDD